MATPKVLVLISGKAQHGKDSFADGLIRLTPIKRGNALTFKKYAFAKNVKATAYKLGWDGKKDAKGRAFLQAIGSNARAYDPDIWVRFLLNDLETDSRLPFIAISDCRYENESVSDSPSCLSFPENQALPAIHWMSSQTYWHLLRYLPIYHFPKKPA